MIRELFGLGPSVDYKELVDRGAIILDVRTKGEYDQGHVKGSINISVDALSNQLNRLKDKNKPIITCCATGMRSGSAKRLLISKGYKEVHNGGSWYKLEDRIS